MTHDIATLRTERLLLRPLRADDARAITDGIDNIDVAKWLSVVPFPYGMDDAHAFLSSAAVEPRVTWGICDADGLCGVVSIRPELGYWIARGRWGRGYLTEAGRAARDAAFADPTRRTLTARHMAGNDRSARVLEKLGFTVIGETQNHYRALNQRCTSVVLRLTRPEWRRLRRATGQDRAGP